MDGPKHGICGRMEAHSPPSLIGPAFHVSLNVCHIVIEYRAG